MIVVCLWIKQNCALVGADMLCCCVCGCAVHSGGACKSGSVLCVGCCVLCAVLLLLCALCILVPARV